MFNLFTRLWCNHDNGFNIYIIRAHYHASHFVYNCKIMCKRCKKESLQVVTDETYTTLMKCTDKIL